MAGRRQAEEARPHFFLSYARPRYRPEDGDRWVAKFFNDLCQDISQATGAHNPGFMDRQIGVGTEWPDQLADALANCRVFVALFSPAYFTSAYCGKEWAAFLSRYQAQTAGLDSPPAIIPALWTRMSMGEIPEPLHSMQNIPPEFPPAYGTEGLYGIMKLGRFREQYKETVLRLATVVKDRAAECALPFSEVPALATVQSPFSDATPGSPRPAVRLTLAAQAIGQLAPGRDPYYYGRTPREWTPFRTEKHTMPIGSFAAQVLSELGHESIVETADESPQDPMDAPGVLVVDPWAVKDRVIGKRLQQIDGDRDPAPLLAPFNYEDPETAERADALGADLAEVLPNASAVKGSAPRVTSARAFRDVLPKAVNEALTRHLRTTDVHPPQAPPSTSRPTLRDPES
ncbi:TIR-like protein FxsC [Actinomadura sp. 7K507]|uniref:TIR-like protein FxsC n=1 Tax=Actinomadura sp. 7K507 TaxID=2530365 RepID=UPI00104EA821|nr:TIR-like protein FxsC [Actinomadura sp. 7K507]TDC96979.1 TIR domain-containing protein [Actinomadura sp. 7K507]